MPAGPFCTSTNILTSWVQRDGYKSGATLTEVPLRQTCLLIRCHSQICLLVQCNSFRHACWVHLSRYMCLLSASPSGKKPGMLQIHQTCLQVRCGSHGFVKLVSNQPGRHLELFQILSDASAASLGCYKDDVCNSRISKSSILHAMP